MPIVERIRGQSLENTNSPPIPPYPTLPVSPDYKIENTPSKSVFSPKEKEGTDITLTPLDAAAMGRDYSPDVTYKGQIEYRLTMGEVLQYSWDISWLNNLLNEIAAHKKEFTPDDNYDVFDDLSGYEQYSDKFVGVESREESMAIKHRIDEEWKKEEMLSYATFPQITLAKILTDPIIAIIFISLIIFLAKKNRISRAIYFISRKTKDGILISIGFLTALTLITTSFFRNDPFKFFVITLLLTITILLGIISFSITNS